MARSPALPGRLRNPWPSASRFGCARGIRRPDLLASSRSRLDRVTGTSHGIRAVARRFTAAGVHHILIGPDRIMFLVGLLLLGGSIRRLIVVVSAFTLAHSITLSLAALNIVALPSSVVEPAIALSIACIGVDNLMVRGGRDLRAWMAFAFGFVHGFGFAGVLREMGLESRALIWSLLSFNLGVIAAGTFWFLERVLSGGLT